MQNWSKPARNKTRKDAAVATAKAAVEEPLLLHQKSLLQHKPSCCVLSWFWKGKENQASWMFLLLRLWSLWNPEGFWNHRQVWEKFAWTQMQIPCSSLLKGKNGAKEEKTLDLAPEKSQEVRRMGKGLFLLERKRNSPEGGFWWESCLCLWLGAIKQWEWRVSP